jgi:hypothetical protein
MLYFNTLLKIGQTLKRHPLPFMGAYSIFPLPFMGAYPIPPLPFMGAYSIFPLPFMGEG